MGNRTEPLLSVAAAAREIGVHKSTLARQIRSGAVRSHEGKVRVFEVRADRKRRVGLHRSWRWAGKPDFWQPHRSGHRLSPRRDPTSHTADPTSHDLSISLTIGGKCLTILIR